MVVRLNPSQPLYELALIPTPTELASFFLTAVNTTPIARRVLFCPLSERDQRWINTPKLIEFSL